MPALQLGADDHLSRPIDAVDLKHRLGNVETDCRDRFHGWLPITATAPAAVTSMALTRRGGSRPQHQKQPFKTIHERPGHDIWTISGRYGWNALENELDQ